jgi:hypothetical protein
LAPVISLLTVATRTGSAAVAIAAAVLPTRSAHSSSQGEAGAIGLSRMPMAQIRRNWQVVNDFEHVLASGVVCNLLDVRSIINDPSRQ